jgi:serine/threonine protein kinase
VTTSLKRQPIPFGKYLLLDRINIGGMAEVWRGKQVGASGFERLVAIKRILPNIAEDEEFITMFIDEAKITVQLTHANIAQVYELGHVQNSYFIAMEYIAGKDMRAIFDRCRKKSEPAPVPLTCYAVSKLCEGLDYAHRKKDGMGRDMNIVHRDVSPQNILISYEGEVKVIDFGIAKAAGKATKTQAGILKGKFAYMSPEQIRGLPLDRRSDVFAIGVCLYELLTGERLFVGDSDFSVLEKVRKAEVTPPSHFNKRVPEALEKIVLRALAKEVDDRYQYASEVADDLQRFLITSDSIFSRKDLMQYMKSTFAEDVEREKLRMQEYADVQAPEGMADAAERGDFDLLPRKPSGILPPMAKSAPPPVNEGPPVLIPAVTVPAVPPKPKLEPFSTGAAAIKRSPSLGLLPRLTAAAPMLSNQEDPGAGATVLVDNNPYHGDPLGDVETDPTEKPAVADPFRLTAAPAEKVAPAGADPTAILPSNGVVSKPADATAILGKNGPLIPAADPPPLEPEPHTAAMSPNRKALRTATGNGAMSAASPALDKKHARERVRMTSAPPLTSAPTQPGLFSGLQRRQIILFSTVAGLGAVLVAALIILLVQRQPATGWLVLYVPQELEGKAHVNINGHDEDLTKLQNHLLMKQLPAGNALVLVTAEGYEAYTDAVQVHEGQAVTQVRPKLKPLVQTAEIAFAVDPPQAEIRIDGQVVKREGDGNGIYLGHIPAGREAVVEVRKSGFKRSDMKITAAAGAEPLRRNVKLDVLQFSLQVGSEPKGASIVLGGKEMGVTPATVPVAGSAASVLLKKKCFEDLELPLKLPEVAQTAPIPLTGSLKKQPGCH